MVTLEELQTYTIDELITLKNMIRDLLSIKPDIKEKVFFSQLKNNQEITFNELYENYTSWCEETKNTPKIKQEFNMLAHIYIKEFDIKMAARKKEKKEKIKNPGIATKKIE